MAKERIGYEGVKGGYESAKITAEYV